MIVDVTLVHMAKRSNRFTRPVVWGDMTVYYRPLPRPSIVERQSDAHQMTWRVHTRAVHHQERAKQDTLTPKLW
jgi:hypothetical protein